MFSLDLFSKHDFVNCGAGLDIQIKLTSGSRNCTVKVKPELKHGKVLTWRDNDLGDCAYFDLDNSSKVLVQTLSNIVNFCPLIIELRMSNSNYTSYRSEMEDKIYSYNTNELGHSLVKIWPTTSGMNYETVWQKILWTFDTNQITKSNCFGSRPSAIYYIQCRGLSSFLKWGGK